MSTRNTTGAPSPAITAVLSMLVFVLGCAGPSRVGDQAARSGALGAVGGAVAGAVGSLLWGGNPFEGAVKGGLTEAASGAAVGAVSAAMADDGTGRADTVQPQSRTQSRPQPQSLGDRQGKLDALRAKIGEKNYRAALLLADCKHAQAIAAANDAFSETDDPTQRAYALLLQAVAAEEKGDAALAASLYPRMAAIDPERGSLDKARSEALEGVLKVKRLRRDHGLPPICTP